MKVAELARAMGVSRQWLNKLVNRGLVYGVSRNKANGRLVIAEEAGTESEFLRNVRLFNDELKPATNGLAETVKRLRIPPKAKQRSSSREFHRTIRTATLITRLFGDFEERDPDLYRAYNYLPLAEGVKLLRESERFTTFERYPLFEWAVSARTEKSFKVRCAVVEFEHARNPEQFRNQTDIAEKFGVTRAAVSKMLRQMPLKHSERRRRSARRPAA